MSATSVLHRSAESRKARDERRAPESMQFAFVAIVVLGVAAAIVAERWLSDDAPRWCEWAAGALVTLALFDHVSGFLLAAGMLAVAGVRADRRAWVWRAAIGAAIALWAVAWGTSFAHQ